MTHPTKTNPAQALSARVAACATLLLALGGCASAPLPTEQLAVAEAAVQRADTSSTQQAAPAELAVAVAKLARARSAVVAGDNLLARRMADEATVDAQVAEQRAQARRAAAAASESDTAARALREEINRKTVR